MEIDIESEAIQLETYWKDRDAQFRSDRDRINLVKDPSDTKKIKWKSNEPKVFYETATSLISSYPPRFRLPLTINYTPEEKDKMNKGERLLLGIFRALDDRQMSIGRSYWMRELAWWILSGWSSVFVWTHRKGNSVEFLAELFDPITVYPDWNSDGLVRCVRSYITDKKSASQMVMSFAQKGLKKAQDYLEPRDQTEVKIVNYWYDDKGKIYNAIMIGGQEVKPLTEEKQFKQIPIFITTVGMPERTSKDWPVRLGENIIAANRDMYDYDEQMISLMATIMAETAYPNLVSQTNTGTPVIKRELQGYGEEIALKRGEQIEILKHAATPQEVNILLSWTGKQKQKGSIPDIVYGGVPFELSGFAISQLMAAIRYKIAPYLNTYQSLIGRIGSEFLMQYKNGDGNGSFPKISLSTVNPQEIKKGLFFVEEFSPKDVPESNFVEVTVPITSAMDKTQQILFARQAMSPPQLLSRETIWDDILDVQDSDQEYARIIQDQTLEMPIMKQIYAMQELRKREQRFKDQGLAGEANAMHKYIMGLEMQLGMRQGIPETPSGNTGVSPNALPPEMMNSPDQTRAAMGVGPPGLSRRPQTTEERAESKLVNTQGQPLL